MSGGRSQSRAWHTAAAFTAWRSPAWNRYQKAQILYAPRLSGSSACTSPAIRQRPTAAIATWSSPSAAAPARPSVHGCGSPPVAKADGIELAFVNPSALLTQAYRGVGLFSAPLPVRIVGVYPSWDRFVFMVHPRTGIRSLADIKAKRYPLRVSVREDPTHSTLVLIDQAFALHGFALKDIESWGGRLVLCGGPSDVRRLVPLGRGEIDAVFDEGIKVWLDEALAAGLSPIELEPTEFDAMARLGWRKVSL